MLEVSAFSLTGGAGSRSVIVLYSAGIFFSIEDFAFDIAWYVRAGMLSENPTLEDFVREGERPEGIMICCHHCGRFFTRNAGHQQYCDRPDCPKA